MVCGRCGLDTVFLCLCLSMAIYGDLQREGAQVYYFTDIDVNSVMMEKGISATAARVLSIVNRFVHASRMKGIRDGRGIPYSYASREAIAQRVGKSVRTVARAMAELKAAGLIEVKRTRRNAHVFICYYGVCGTSGSAENGTSNNSNTKNINNNQVHNPIYLRNTETVNGQMSMDGLLNSATAEGKGTQAAKTAGDAGQQRQQEGQREQQPKENSSRGTASSGQQRPAAEEQRQDAPRDAATIHGSASAEAVNRDRTKGRPTPKRQQPTKAEKEAARQRYKRHLMERLCKWCPWDADSWEEYDRLEGLADMIADAVSADSRVIKVNGCSLTAAQYWNVVQNIENSFNLMDMFDRINTAEVCSGVRNTRAYTLAAVYNAVQWDGLMRGANVKTEALYRAMPASAYGA